MSDARTRAPTRKSSSNRAGKSPATKSPGKSPATRSPGKSPATTKSPATKSPATTKSPAQAVVKAEEKEEQVLQGSVRAPPTVQDAMRGEEAMRRAKQAYLRRAMVANGGLAALATPRELATMGVPRTDYLALRRGSNMHVDVDSEVDRKTAEFRDRLSRQLRQRMSRDDPTTSSYMPRYYDDDDDQDLWEDSRAMPGYVVHRLRSRLANLECSCGFGCGLGTGCLHLAALQHALLGCGGCSHCTECYHVASVLEMMRTCGQCSHVRQYRNDKGQVMFEL